MTISLDPRELDTMRQLAGLGGGPTMRFACHCTDGSVLAVETRRIDFTLGKEKFTVMVLDNQNGEPILALSAQNGRLEIFPRAANQVYVREGK